MNTLFDLEIQGEVSNDSLVLLNPYMTNGDNKLFIENELRKYILLYFDSKKKSVG